MSEATSDCTDLTNPVWDSSAGLAGNINTLLGRHHLALLSDNNDSDDSDSESDDV